ncbi:hypothetical protein CPLU01_15741 [Colletotrichum plurivorum]|uniref:Uncharacterized protein n=1 Tax=Colletotrichum plurivorum TaxID=2175906 RepID=A0A8H6MT00_9PEZI|nr:hypothetical protein CPLU01_15741 [Colletotrichum plurivorum]
MSNNVTWPPIPRKIGNEDLPDASDDPYMQPDGVDTTELTSWMLKHSGPFLSSWVAKHFRDNPNAVRVRIPTL